MVQSNRPAQPYRPPHQGQATAPPRFLQGFANRGAACSISRRREVLRRR
jgi:hypothetical protein